MQIVRPDININFMKATRFTTALSIGLVLASIGLLGMRGLNLGTDFTGGTKILVKFKNSFRAQDKVLVQKAFDEEGLAQKFGTTEAPATCSVNKSNATTLTVAVSGQRSGISAEEQTTLFSELSKKAGFRSLVDIKDTGGTLTATYSLKPLARKDLREATKTLAEETEKKDAQIDVQDFVEGAGSRADIARYQISTQLTSVLTDKVRDSIKKAITENAAFKDQLDGPVLNTTDGEDKFLIQLTEKRNLQTAEVELRAIFKAQGLDHVAITSDVEVRAENAFYKRVNMEMKDGLITEKENRKRRLAYQEERALRLEGQGNAAWRIEDPTDTSFYVSVEQLRAKLETKFSKEFPGSFQGIDSSSSISATVGQAMFNKGLLAIIYALLGILAYIWLRFDIRYSPGAVVALAHDVLITLGLFALFQIKFSLSIVAALLTIVGYSLNDTIVVYDRIRENTKRMRQLDIRSVVNRSINETLSRTLLTSITTLIVVLSLLFFGGGLISDFALALAIGVIIGTYSSVYVASPVVLLLDRFVEQKKEDQRSATPRTNAV
ncbi:MAG: protein translocase subunit SecF [Myxococcales bacterium]|nr:protein translocase subunit SecF [Myxococcales bacterium]|tara:strand:- start:2466 stop:4115 length:1650 start_codon:yes stop_codon:yes gene_type:complete